MTERKIKAEDLDTTGAWEWDVLTIITEGVLGWTQPGKPAPADDEIREAQAAPKTLTSADLEISGIPAGHTVTVVDGIAQWRSWAEIHAGRVEGQQREAVQA